MVESKTRGSETIQPLVRELILNQRSLAKLQDESDRGLWRENVSFLEKFLEFVQEVEEGNEENSKKVAKTIFNTFISKNSAAQINLDDQEVAHIEKSLKSFITGENTSTNLFDSASKNVSNLIYVDKVETLLKIKGTENNQLSAKSSLGSLSSQGSSDQDLLDSAEKVLKNSAENWVRGPLFLKRGSFSKWTLYTFVKKGHFLFQFKLGANHITQEPIQVINLSGCKINKSFITSKPFTFLLVTNQRKSYELRASNFEEFETWIQMLSKEGNGERIMRVSCDNLSSYSAANSVETETEADDKETEITKKTGPNLKEEVRAVLSCLESFTDSVIVSDSSGVIIDINSVTSQMFGYSKEEAIGKEVTIFMPEPYKSQHCAYIFRHEKFGDAKLLGKTRNLRGERKDRTSFPIQISLSKFSDHFMATIRELPEEEGM